MDWVNNVGRSLHWRRYRQVAQVRRDAVEERVPCFRRKFGNTFRGLGSRRCWCGDADQRKQSRAETAAPATSSTRVIRSPGGKSLRIDMHCHYLNQAVAAKVAHLNPAQYEPSVEFANALTREVNVKQMRDRGSKLSAHCHAIA